MRKRLKKIAIWLLVASLGWCVILGAIVWRYGTHDRAAKSDCIIVLGAAVQGATASPVFEERIRHGLSLYDSGYAPKLLFTRGIGDGQTHSEASVGRSAAIQHRIPAVNILVEEKSRTTQQNLSEALAVMRQHGLKSAVIVSDPLHMKRSMMMADDLDIPAVSSPTPTSRYRSLKTKLVFLLREIYFIHHYIATGQ
ncbi:MAG: YdcF family protein [Verrucomicrobia bacterium]|nr:MAG: YdcF family protein [Verrucomicrobiota bacterium]